MNMQAFRLASVPAMALFQAACSSPVDSGDANDPLRRGAATRACDPAAVTDPPYGSIAALDALVVGRWARCKGPPQIAGEQLGVDFTEGRVILPLAHAPDGGAEDVPPTPGVGPESWSALVDASGRVRLLFLWASSPSKDMSSIVVDGPTFFDGAEQMFLPYGEVGASYTRLAP